MKVLDVSSLHDGIKEMSWQLSELEKQLNHVKSGIRSFVSSKDSFRGKGASAIRRFYEYAHLPFLQFFQTFLANFQSKLQQLQYELDGLEDNSRGFIDESFLASELKDGLNQINRMVTDLTGETNAQLSRISDIVYLPRLQDHQFHEGIQQAKQSANQTVDKLRQFDHQQTQSFTAITEDLSLLQNYIEEMSQQFASGKIKLTSFSPVMLQDLEAYGKLQTKLYNQTVMQRWNSEHFPELGVFFPIGYAASFDQWANPSCARPEPKKKTTGEAFWDFTNGFGAGIISAASDTWDGIKRLATEPDQVLKETIEFLDAVVSDPGLVLEIGHELYNSFNESVIHGDATSRGEWLGYATTIIGTSVVGDKGLSKVGGIAGKLGTKVETDLDIKLKNQREKVTSSVKGSSVAGLERVRELMGHIMPAHHLQPGFAGVPHNVMDSMVIRDRVEAQNHLTLSKVEKNADNINIRHTPGVATTNKVSNAKVIMRGTDGNAGVVPKEVADRLKGKSFKNFDAFRSEFWKTVSTSSYAGEFSSANIKRMEKGFAPIASKSQHYGKQKSYVLHHLTPINHGGGVYDIDNLLIVSPRLHQDILSKSYHFGNK
ncbi:hypothetical protein B4U37_19945 [Sutcliffiella horikoshii]|uniref:LXG domain-containing protein n=1 Tax=Sutcliffiella horikoshii TaxID=79883 RepID=A0ABM6KNM9_9BACI|nr:LXG domain-containing protein [Sutcliffiella horikoshii]ART78173.1 hypothetical protein B4U37_19945 [Sutcliffiella horikoshii]